MPAARVARGRRSLAELERRLRAEPGVEQVAFADRLPVMDESKYSVDVDTATGAPATGLRCGIARARVVRLLCGV